MTKYEVIREIATQSADNEYKTTEQGACKTFDNLLEAKNYLMHLLIRMKQGHQFNSYERKNLGEKSRGGKIVGHRKDGKCFTFRIRTNRTKEAA